MSHLRTVVIGLMVSFVSTAAVMAAAPNLITLQGRLTDAGGTPLSGTHSVQFAIYNAPVGSTAVWQETQSITSNADGLFSVLLGAANPFGFSTLADTNCYLGITVDADPELTPRTRLVSSPYALRIATVDSALGGTIVGTVSIDRYAFGVGLWSNSLDFGSHPNIGVYAQAQNSQVENIGVIGEAGAGGDISYVSSGIYGQGDGGAWAGYFDGQVNVTQSLSAAAKYFRIDDPVDPANDYMEHACVESDEYKDIYDGTALLDDHGRATVTLPSWFDDLNAEFRYQLTCVGGYSPVYIADQIADNHFTIAGGTPGLEVSWMVTGVRKDPYALAHPVQVETAKPQSLRGTYLHPKEYGVDAKLGEDYAVRNLHRQKALLTSNQQTAHNSPASAGK